MELMKPGARYHRADLHTHTPASKDYTDKKATPEEIIRAAESTGVEILAITDHNTAEWVDRVRVAADGRSIRIIPGVEVTTPQGHILALFDCDAEAGMIADFLIAVGIPREKHGDQDAISKSIEMVLEAISDAGGLAIAAHANTKKIGLLQRAKGQHAMKVSQMPELTALEFTKNEDVKRFSQGKVSNYPAKACTQSSDSHSLSEIGQRITLLKMDSVALEGIRQSLFDHESRVRFPWNFAESNHPRIVSLEVDQGFFADERFRFHEGLNCLVGGKGVGKSTVIELLRYCFADVSEFDTIHEDHDGKIKSLVGPGGAIVVEYLDSDGELKTVRREVDPGENPAREVRDSSGNPTSIETPPTFFSQGELVLVASSQIAQLDLLDRTLDLGRDYSNEADVIHRLEVNAKQLVKCSERIANLEEELEDSERGMEATRNRHKEHKKKLKDPVLEKFANWESEQKYLTDAKGALEALPGEIDDALEAIDLDIYQESPPEDTPHKAQLAKVARALKRVDKTMDKFTRDLSAELERIAVLVDETSTSLAPEYEKQKAKYEETLHGLGAADLRNASTQFRNLGKRLNTLKKNARDLTTMGVKDERLWADRTKLVGRLKAVRTRRMKKRAAKAENYEKALAGLVRIVVIDGGDRTQFIAAIRELAEGSYMKRELLAKVAIRIEPSEFVRYVLFDDTDGLTQAAGITRGNTAKLIAHFQKRPLDELYALEVTELPDRPELYYKVSDSREKPLHELSTGQKGTVIMELALVDGGGPLIIDHPEEPLDTQSIYGQVVRALRSMKEQRQFLFTTHNPNIAVSADAELNHILEATADRGFIKSSGSIDHPSTRQLLLLHLEGGSDALALRMGKYGVTTT